MSTPVKKKSSPLLTIAVLVALIWVLSLIYQEPDPEPDVDSQTTYGTTQPAVVTPVYPGVPDHLQNQIFLDWRGHGACEYMTGEIVATTILIDDAESSWSGQEIEVLKAEQELAATRLTAEAAGYGTYARVRLEYIQVSVSEILKSDDHGRWSETVLAAAGLPGVQEVGTFLEKKYGVESAPIFFYLNKTGRSFAQPAYGDQGEYAVIYLRMGDFRHEMNHIYGAKDYYYPNDYKTVAESLFPDSIMLVGETGVVTDSLTAYVIGWTDELSPEACSFLEQTAHVTGEILTQGYEDETFTGYRSKEGTQGIYTGDWVAGAYQGYGRMDYYSGDSYEGEWNYGSPNGQGTYRFADGTVYSGAWVNGLQHGYGICTWPNGDVYEGYWENGTLTGYGTLTKTDGTKFTGNWKNGEFLG